MKSNNIIDLEAILDMAIDEIKKGNISSSDCDIILMSLIDDYKKIGNSPPNPNFVREKIEKYLKK